jgi:hypothetical protein
MAAEDFSVTPKSTFRSSAESAVRPEHGPSGGSILPAGWWVRERAPDWLDGWLPRATPRVRDLASDTQFALTLTTRSTWQDLQRFELLDHG